MGQKRLLLKSEEVVQKNSIIQETENRQLEMKKDLARQSGKDELSMKINSYQHEIRERSRQLKAMASELNMQQAQCKEYKRETESQAQELHSWKSKYHALARRKTLEK